MPAPRGVAATETRFTTLPLRPPTGRTSCISCTRRLQQIVFRMAPRTKRTLSNENRHCRLITQEDVNIILFYLCIVNTFPLTIIEYLIYTNTHHQGGVHLNTIVPSAYRGPGLALGTKLIAWYSMDDAPIRILEQFDKNGRWPVYSVCKCHVNGETIHRLIVPSNPEEPGTTDLVSCYEPDYLPEIRYQASNRVRWPRPGDLEVVAITSPYWMKSSYVSEKYVDFDRLAKAEREKIFSIRHDKPYTAYRKNERALIGNVQLHEGVEIEWSVGEKGDPICTKMLKDGSYLRIFPATRLPHSHCFISYRWRFVHRVKPYTSPPKIGTVERCVVYYYPTLDNRVIGIAYPYPFGR